MQVNENDTVLCPNCGEEHGEAKFMVDPASPYVPNVTDCSECGEPFQVVQLDEENYEVSWA